jgi:hypothetical protein
MTAHEWKIRIEEMMNQIDNLESLQIIFWVVERLVVRKGV